MTPYQKKHAGCDECNNCGKHNKNTDFTQFRCRKGHHCGCLTPKKVRVKKTGVGKVYTNKYGLEAVNDGKGNSMSPSLWNMLQREKQPKYCPFCKVKLSKAALTFPYACQKCHKGFNYKFCMCDIHLCHFHPGGKGLFPYPPYVLVENCGWVSIGPSKEILTMAREYVKHKTPFDTRTFNLKKLIKFLKTNPEWL